MEPVVAVTVKLLLKFDANNFTAVAVVTVALPAEKSNLRLPFQAIDRSAIVTVPFPTELITEISTN